MKPEERKKVKSLLREGAWFRKLPDTLQDAFLDRSVPRTYAAGRILADQGSRPDGLFALLEGRLAWRRTTDAGENLLLYIAGPGAWFGQLALVRDTVQQFGVVAHSAARVLLLPRAEYRRLIEEDTGNYRCFADQALERFEILIRLYADGRSLQAGDLIPSRLATLAALRRAERGQRGDAVELGLSQTEIAEMIGVSRQTLNTELKRLEENKLIEVGFRRLRILDPARLPGARPVRAPRPGARARRTR